MWPLVMQCKYKVIDKKTRATCSSSLKVQIIQVKVRYYDHRVTANLIMAPSKLHVAETPESETLVIMSAMRVLFPAT